MFPTSWEMKNPNSFADILVGMARGYNSVAQVDVDHINQPEFYISEEPENTVYGRRWCRTVTKTVCNDLTLERRKDNHFQYTRRLTSKSFALFMITMNRTDATDLNIRCFFTVDGVDHQMRMHNKFHPIPGETCPVFVNLDLPRGNLSGLRRSVISGNLRFELWDSFRCLQVRQANKTYTIENRKGPKEVKK